MQTSIDQERQLWERWIEVRDGDAGNELIKKYTPLVTYHVQRISVGLPQNVCRDELHSLGLMGLFDALEKFDPGRDLKFDTYASFRVRGAIIDGLRKEDWLPRSSREKAKRLEATIEKLEQKHMRNVTTAEIAQELKIDESEVYKTMNEYFLANILSIDEQPQDDDDGDQRRFVIRDDKAEIPEESILKQELISELSAVIAKLNKNEQLVISLFYEDELTLTEIGQIMDLSTSRISQIHSKALFKLRKILEKKL